tara:strand:+ start:200 stop:409 length:210 start_codon:yes stop_codon:yes gene_type:complete
MDSAGSLVRDVTKTIVSLPIESGKMERVFRQLVLLPEKGQDGQSSIVSHILFDGVCLLWMPHQWCVSIR